MKIMKKIFKHMKYLKKFKTKADAVGQTIAIPGVLSIGDTSKSVGFLNTNIGIKETEIVDTEDKSFVEGEYMQYITITYDVSSTTSTTQILYKVGNVTKMFYRGGEVPVSTSYKFPETGNQRITFALSNKKCVTVDQFRGCNAIVDIQLGSRTKVLNSYSFNNTSIEDVTLPVGTVYIGEWAFAGCKNLKSINIPDSVIHIGNFAFSSCYNLSKVSIGNSLIKIGYTVFGWCKSLSKVTLPESLESIGNGAFKGCISLREINIPNSITSIESDVFSGCTSLTDVTIPDSVISIGNDAFNGCTSLTGITIPDSVVRIGKDAFWNCPCYEIEGNVKYIDNWVLKCEQNIETYILRNNTRGIMPQAFTNNNSLKYITIPDSVIYIGSNAFYGCSILSSVTIGDSVKEIGSEAFNHCRSLSHITIPNSVINMGEYTFNNCSSLPVEDNVRYADKWAVGVTVRTAITYTLRNNTVGVVGMASLTTTVITIPDGVTSIGDYAFYNCSNLTGITIPDGVTSIGNYAFLFCKNLTEITIPDGVTSIGNYAFSGCSNLTTITIPDSVISIGDYAFNGCSNLTGITIPDGVTSIGDYAFSLCSKLTGITIPDSVISIGNYAFKGCSNLTEITIPDGVTSIGDYAFNSSSSKIKHITIGSGLKLLYPNAFKGITIPKSNIINNSSLDLEAYEYGGATIID